jgi:uncharacterized protein (TIGR02147 family)
MESRSVLTFSDFRSFLKEELELRKARNPRYSLRSFARDLNLSAPRLSDVLKVRYGLSRPAAHAVAERLRFNRAEADYFCDLVEAEHGRSRCSRQGARKRLDEAQTFTKTSDWNRFQSLSNAEGILESIKNWIGSQPAGVSKRIEVLIRHES